MFEMRYATLADQAYWFTLDQHMRPEEFPRKVRDRRAYIISLGQQPVGILRYHLFWDNTPFLTLIHLEKAHRNKGWGRQAMAVWEAEMRNLGYPLVMTSTQSDESAQHFYRKLGYQDRGALFLDGTPMAQPPELFLIKVL